MGGNEHHIVALHVAEKTCQRLDGLGIPALTLTFIFLSFNFVGLALSAAADLLNLIGSIIIPECLITAGRVISLQVLHKRA